MIDLFWSLRESPRRKPPAIVARAATYADDDDSGLLSMIVTHKSRNLRELSRVQSLVVDGFYNYNDTLKLFGTVEPLGRALREIGANIRGVKLGARKYTSEIAYNPSADTVGAKLETSAGRTKVSCALGFSKFTSSFFALHKEQFQTKVALKYDLQKRNIQGKLEYTWGTVKLEGTANVGDDRQVATTAAVEKQLNEINKASLRGDFKTGLGTMEFKSRADNLPFTLSAQFPFEATRSDFADVATLTFKTRINVFNL